jgi:hypothetical protein
MIVIHFGCFSPLTFYEFIKFDGFVKSLLIVMPDLIRHPEPIEFTGFRLPPE